ncbi:DUF4194 domain-containing protein [Tessaracoccus sp. SD287]|uniref:DUF4194 domain-containing protein n=1 Tax=Tessaracoccus sp. SD287 TaxID=2782008 RepID=UPI001A95C965|nr:DUF4194 domain-containing protein [Tessaracoccus sp. SD287]MBO1032023.1 DUF4194 domain-containing protein [Tessaracoccus sp. SD287]
MTEQIDYLDEEVEDTGEHVHEDDTEQLSLAMFEGDTSTLFPEQRLCLHAVLKHRYISAERHPEHWATLLADLAVVKSRLNDLFLDIHVDTDHKIAFKRAAVPEGDDSLPSLVRNVSYTKEETIVLIALRQRFLTQRQEGDDVVFVERQALLDEVADQRPDHATNRSMDSKRANNAIDGLATAGVLLRTSDPDRFRVSPIIEILLPVEQMRALWTWLFEANGGQGEAPGADLEGDVDGDGEPEMLPDDEEGQP